MSETGALRFQQAYDEARSAITSSLNSVKETYEGIQRDLGNEIKTQDSYMKELTASLNKANVDIEGLNGVIRGLENELAASKELAATTQKTLEVRTIPTEETFLNFFTRIFTELCPSTPSNDIACPSVVYLFVEPRTPVWHFTFADGILFISSLHAGREGCRKGCRGRGFQG